MAKLNDGTRINGSLTVDAAIIAGAGAGFQNLQLFTTGTNLSYGFTGPLRVAGTKFKLTIIGGGGGGAGSISTTTGSVGGGGQSGDVCVVYLTATPETPGFIYSVGAAGTAGAIGGAGGTGGTSFVTYNGLTYTANGGTGGQTSSNGSVANGGGPSNGLLNLTGGWGSPPGVAVSGSTAYYGYGGDTPLGFGRGGHGGGYLAANGAGVVGVGFGAGGGGGYSTSTTGYVGGAGTIGLIILEY